MEPFMIFFGIVAAVVVLVLVSSTGLRTQQGYRGSPGRGQGNQGPQQWQNNPPGQERNWGGGQPRQFGGAGGRGRSGGGLLQLLAIVGVLVLMGACGLLIVALAGVR
jgi:hypothetical protein